MVKKKEQEAETEFVSKTPKELEKECDQSIEDFNELLATLGGLDEKRRALWRSIYQNSVLDRRNAYIMFSDLYQKVHGHGEQHALHGSVLAKYLERLGKSNEQLIKLASLVEQAIISDENDNTPDDADIYAQLGKINANKRKG